MSTFRLQLIDRHSTFLTVLVEGDRAGRVRVKTRTRVDSSHIFWKTRTRLGLEILETLTRLYDSSHSLKKIFIRFYKNITIYKIKFPIIHKKLNILHRNHFSRSFFLSIHSYIVVNDSAYDICTIVHFKI
jgi:hypothetical protein